jgi:hypothetical protein
VSRFIEHGATLALFVSFATAASGEDAPEVRREDALKAAYLFNFTKFVDWAGEAADAPLTLCIAGASNLRRALAADIASKRIGAHSVKVREVNAQEEAAGCSVLYVESLNGPVKLPAADLRAPVLTVSDAAGFARQGGTIELFTEGNRLRFIVNVDNARRAGIRISSSLLQLASVVEKDRQP